MKKQAATVATAAILTTTFASSAFADTYLVQPGDTLSIIAKKYNTTVNELKTLNNLRSDLIFAHQAINVPASTSSQVQPAPAPVPVQTAPAAPQTYTIVSGDTLIKIANRHGISLAELKTWNGIESHLIYPGNVLVVSNPGQSAQVVQPVTGSTGQAIQPVAGSTAQQAPTTTSIITDNADSSFYVIKRGDSLSKIAVAHGMTVNHLKSINQLSSDLIFPGQKLSVNGSSAVSPPPAQKVTEGSTGGQNVQATATVSTTDQIIYEAKKLTGIPYLWGGSTPAGFDCSGFIYYVHNKAGVKLGRYSAAGYYDRTYYVNQPQVGDFVFFENTYKQGISHLGIYVGNNQFIHAGSDGVQISSLSSGYWAKHFESFKRLY